MGSISVLIYPLLLFCGHAVEQCDRRLYEAKGERRSGNNGFTIEINQLNNRTENESIGFIPGDSYLIALRGWRTKYTVQTFRGFGITAQLDNDQPGGKFEIHEKRGEARMAPNCRTAGVSHNSLRPKTSVHVQWKAPDTADAGCVTFRATVIESRNVWYAEDGPLIKRFCLQDGYKTVLPVDDDLSVKCCACDEAKYELEFVGLWSRDTHPNDFPTLEHLTHFTDMLGASHSTEYNLWKMGQLASDGMKEIAEWGNTYKGEQEMKEKAKEIRTIVKVKGLWYPEVQGRTKASFHVNSYHHLASLATMFGPSPDWCVGISSINLCLPDCTWIPERTFELQPWDAGTDDGATYMAPNNPAEPRHPIAPITTKSDPRSPFYNEKSNTIPPLARLVLRRVEIVPSQCKPVDVYQAEAFNVTNTSEDEEYRDRRECSMSIWEQWSLCSATCGKGIRMRSRVYTFPVKAQMFNCHRQTTERQFCNAKMSICEESEAFNTKCQVETWASWSECSVTCGNGERQRRRTFTDTSNTQEECSEVDLEQRDPCTGDSGDDCSVTPDPLCRTTTWSDWSPCSASCGDGVRVRTRLLFYAEHEQRCSHVNLMEKDTCTLQSCRRLITSHSEEICQEEKEAGQCGGTFPRYWYNAKRERCERFIFTGCKGNRNQFETEDECRQACIPGHQNDGGDHSPSQSMVPGQQLVNEFGSSDGSVNDGGDPVPCMLNEWAPWGNCSAICGRGKRQRFRQIKVFPRNGGTPCPDHLVQERRCQLRPCPLQSCVIGPWQSWSDCSVSCGEGDSTRRRRVQKVRDALDEDAACHVPEMERRICRIPCPSDRRE